MPKLHENPVDMTEAQKVFGAIGRATVTKVFCLSPKSKDMSVMGPSGTDIKDTSSEDGSNVVSTGLSKQEYTCWLDCVSVKNGGIYTEKVIRDAHQVCQTYERISTDSRLQLTQLAFKILCTCRRKGYPHYSNLVFSSSFYFCLQRVWR